MKGSKVLLKKDVFKTPLFTVHRQEMVTDDGKKVRQTSIELSPIVCVFSLTASHELYLVSQYHNLYDKVTLQAPSGHTRAGESVLKAAMRELREKVNIAASHWEEIGRVDLTGSVVKTAVHIFLARDLESVKTAHKTDEEITVVKISLGDARRKVIRREISDCATAYGIFVLDVLKMEREL